MIKLYVLYFLLGVYVFWEQLAVWAFFPRDIIVYLTFYSSVIMFSIAPVLSLFKVKLGALIGFVCLIGIAPFAIYWLFYTDYTYIQDQGLIFHLILGVAIILYFIAIFYSLKVLINYKRPITIINLKKTVKIILAVIPIALLLLTVWLVEFAV
jgi:hypothetical protein